MTYETKPTYTAHHEAAKPTYEANPVTYGTPYDMTSHMKYPYHQVNQPMNHHDVKSPMMYETHHDAKPPMMYETHHDVKPPMTYETHHDAKPPMMYDNHQKPPMTYKSHHSEVKPHLEYHHSITQHELPTPPVVVTYESHHDTQPVVYGVVQPDPPSPLMFDIHAEMESPMPYPIHAGMKMPVKVEEEIKALMPFDAYAGMELNHQFDLNNWPSPLYR